LVSGGGRADSAKTRGPLVVETGGNRGMKVGKKKGKAGGEKAISLRKTLDSARREKGRGSKSQSRKLKAE